MNDFEAPPLKDLEPPRVFNTVTTKAVAYNADFVDYLMTQELHRRSGNGIPPMTRDQADDFRRKLVSTLIVQGNAEAAIALRSEHATPALQRKQLNG